MRPPGNARSSDPTSSSDRTSRPVVPHVKRHRRVAVRDGFGDGRVLAPRRGRRAARPWRRTATIGSWGRPWARPVRIVDSWGTMDEGGRWMRASGAGRPVRGDSHRFSEGDSRRVSAPSDGRTSLSPRTRSSRRRADGADVSRLFASDDDDAHVLERRGGSRRRPRCRSHARFVMRRRSRSRARRRSTCPARTVASARAARRRATTRRGGVGRLSYDAAGTGRDGGGREDSQREHRAARVCCGDGDDTRAIVCVSLG